MDLEYLNQNSRKFRNRGEPFAPTRPSALHALSKSAQAYGHPETDFTDNIRTSDRRPLALISVLWELKAKNSIN